MKFIQSTLTFCAAWILLAGCTPGQASRPPADLPAAVTEIPCPGVEPRGLAAGMQAYVSIDHNSTPLNLMKEPGSTEITGSVLHHIRVAIKDGPQCAPSSAWWLVELPDGKSGWLQIGSNLENKGGSYAAALLPFLKDAVQRDVPEERKLEAEVRYIAADIELGGADVLKYYQDQAAAKPEDAETAPIKAALDILAESAGKNIVANADAFERKPLRGGTSVVDAGTEFVQPGLDILLTPCDRPDPSPACQRMLK